MEFSQVGVAAGLVLGGVAVCLALMTLAVRWRRGRPGQAGAPEPQASADPGRPDPGWIQDSDARYASRLTERRMEEIEAVQAELAERMETLAGEAGGARIEALAGSLVTLIRDKNAAMDTALAGLDQLRSRLKAVEQIGNPAEARQLVEHLTGRIDALQTAQAADRAAAQARMDALRSETAQPFSEISDQLTRLYAQKDAMVETVFARLGPLEARMGTLLEAQAAQALPQAALARLTEDIATLRAAQEAVQDQLGALEARTDTRPHAEIVDQLARLYAQKDATVETVFARLAPLEAKLAELQEDLAARDPQTALARFAERLDDVQARFAERVVQTQAAREAAEAGLHERLARLEAPGENPFAEISDQLARLYAQKDATVETVFARLAPLEAKLAELQEDLATRDPQTALARFAERLDDVQARFAERVVQTQAAREAAEAGLHERLARLEAPGENPFAEISDQLARLYAQKDATVETVFARLAPLEAKLAEIERVTPRIETLETALAAQDPRAPLADLAARLDAVDWAQDRTCDQLTGLHATAEADRAALFERFAERLEAVRTALEGRVDALEAPGENPFAEISDQLARLYAQKDATVETVFARLAPLEAKLAEIERVTPRIETLETTLAAQDPRAPLADLAARLDAVDWAQDRTCDQLTGLHATAEADRAALFERFAERLEAVRTALEGRVDALEAPGENPFAEISDQLARLYAQKDATVETVFARLAPLEAKLAELQEDLAARDPQTALARFAERLDDVQARFAERVVQTQAAREAAEAGLHERLARLEAPGENPFAEISDQLARLYAQKDATVETVFARLAPLEAKLAELQEDLATRDPQTALARFAERLDDVQARFAERVVQTQAAREAAEAGLHERLARLEAPGENPFAEISDQLARLYAQKDATVETVFARLAPLEAKLAEIERVTPRIETLETALAAQDPRAPLADLAARLDAVDWAQDRTCDQLTGLHATAEADRAALFERFAERLEAVRTALEGRVDALEAPGENPFAEISDQLARLYAQKDATVETVFARLAPLEAKLAELQEDLAARDPQTALARFAERLDDVQARFAERVVQTQAAREAAEAGLHERLARLEAPGENPFAEISDQLARLYAQKDATVETVFARLAPLEAKLAEIERVTPRIETLETALAAQDPRAPLADLAARLDALQGAQGEAAMRLASLQDAFGEDRAYAEISEQLARLHAQKDAAVAEVAARIGPLETALAELGTRSITEDEARAEAQAIATQMIAARAVAEQTELFANRLSLLEASLPRLSLAQSLMMQALERQSAPWPGSGAAPGAPPSAEPAPEPALHPDPRTSAAPAADPAPAVPAQTPAPEATAPDSVTPDAAASETGQTGSGAPVSEEIEAIWRMPRIVSLHHNK